eukprot:10206390-Lingulodinium_polyedra.AAC.1
MYCVIERVHYEVPPQPASRVETYVDDVECYTEGTRAEVEAAFPRGMSALIRQMQAMGLEVSSKTVILASDARLARQVAGKVAQDTGVEVRAVVNARDLGVDRCEDVQGQAAHRKNQDD